MERKSGIVYVLIISLTLRQIQVEAKSCCPTADARKVYHECRITGASREASAWYSGCIIISGSTCPTGFLYYNRKNSNEKGEIVNKAYKKCIKTCFDLCNKDSIAALETA